MLQVICSFVPPLLAAFLGFRLSMGKTKRKDTVWEFKITISRRFPDNAQT